MHTSDFTRRTVFFEDRKCRSLQTGNVDNLLATESNQLRKQKIHKIFASMEALVDGAGKVSPTKRRQFQVRLNRARQAATT